MVVNVADGRQMDTALNQLLAGYEDLFQEPQGLPPRRDIEHQITLKPEAVPRRMHPYRILQKIYQGYGIMSKPLTELLKKDNFRWTQEASDAFECLKQAMISALILVLLDFTQHFIIEADACDKGIRAVLMQKQRPIAFLSKALSPRNQGLSVYEKEFLAILQAVQKWKHYFIGHHFIIKTDHQSLKHILELKVDNALQQKWISELLGLDYEVQYKWGRDNRAAHALSRKEHGEWSTIIVVIPNWITEVQKSYEKDDELLSIIQAKTIKEVTHPSYTLQGGILRRDQMGKDSELRERL
ncbi:Retrovirus-related Pol polyprotein from transposon.6 [Sesamum angolense]|uniref:Retrovirus-related Pol polyprotein from transposon.6 n=1 Tax=Sesamum angolense TaxID=2727404 RepID=A0AAE1W3T0_9LAMI|nr:Retrovirus-related Pol polyprotein from transposon.6 [Sesamum angolense]